CLSAPQRLDNICWLFLFRLFLDDDDGTASQRDLYGGFCGHAGVSGRVKDV
ncbi:hypothetical protein LTSESEN_0234, partial [Salmonella enterica subsp. enterica serovar Senftenberg str. A4-543]